jgi:hypothetical protein
MCRIGGGIDTACRHGGVKKYDNVRSAMRSTDILILLGYRSGLFVGDDKQERVGLQVFDLESEPAPRIGYRLLLNGAGDLHNGINRRSLRFVQCYDTGDLGCLTSFELVEKRNKEGYDRRNRGKDDLRLAKEVNDSGFGQEQHTRQIRVRKVACYPEPAKFYCKSFSLKKLTKRSP